MNKKIIPRGKYELIHNPGDDFKELVYWMNDKESHIPPYFIPVLALLGTCFAIEGYINMVGQQVDPDWSKFERGHITLKDRLERIYSRINKTLICGNGIWQNVLEIFKIRIEIVHPTYRNQEEIRTEAIPDIFDIVKKKYPQSKSREILENAIDTLLKDTDLNHLKDIGKIEGYSGPIR